MVPYVQQMDVYPVAGKDSMLLNLSGAHAPYFTRNIVVLTDSQGNLGAGEVPGGQKITNALNSMKEIVLGTRLSDYKQTLLKVKSALGNNEEDVRGLQTFDLRTGIHVLTAIEAPLLDLVGQYLEIPVASLLGDGMVRDKVKILGYLFFVGDRKKTDLPYYSDDSNYTDWYRLRHNQALDADSIVELARSSKELYALWFQRF